MSSPKNQKKTLVITLFKIIFVLDNGFQEVRSKKTGKDNKSLSKEELKRPRGKEKGNKGIQGGNANKGTQGKSFTREWCTKPPRMQRIAAFLQHQQQQQTQQEVTDMNKINQNISMFPIRGQFQFLIQSEVL